VDEETDDEAGIGQKPVFFKVKKIIQKSTCKVF
jgi:hypothetical protein